MSKQLTIGKSSINSSIPNIYTQLQYIEGTGNQWLDTTYQMTTNSRIVIDCKFNNVETVQQRVFGYYADESATNDLTTTVYINWSSCFGYAYNYSTTGNWSTNSRHITTDRHIIDYDCENLKLTIDGWETDLPAVSGSVTAAGSVFLMSGSRKTGSTIEKPDSKNQTGLIGYLYSCQIYTSGNLVRNFIPVKRNSDSVVGLWDTVNSIFYTSGSSTGYIAGPNLPSNTKSVAIGTQQASTTENVFICDVPAKFLINDRMANAIADYVVLDEENNGIRIKRWASGFQEVWIQENKTISVSKTWISNNMYYIDYSLGNWSSYGVEWATIPMCIGNPKSVDHNFWLCGFSDITTTSRGTVRYVRPTTLANVSTLETFYYYGYYR